MRFKHLIRGTASVVALSVAVTGAAYAQAQGQEPQVFGELIVTAQKREQRLQDVPVVVTVVGAQLLQDAGIHDIKDLTVLTPGMTVTSSSSEASTTVRIRGIGTVGDNPGLESSVGVVIDGVYRPRNGVALSDLGEMNRIEVLKGPQGTLFGKNSTAGVINILTAAPSFNPGANLEAGASNFGGYRATGSVTGPISGDTLAGRLFLGLGKRDGFQSVVVGGGPRTVTNDGDRDFQTARGQLLWLPSSNLDVKLIADYTNRDENCCSSVTIVPGSFASAVTNSVALGGVNVQSPAVAGSRLVYSDRSTAQATEDKGVSVEANWSSPWFGGAKLTSLTAVRNWEVNAGQDSDFTTLDLLHRDPNGQNFTQFDQSSQELRLSNTNGRFTWTAGGFYAHEKLTSSQTLTVGDDLSAYLDVLVRTSSSVPFGGAPGNNVSTGGLAYILGAAPNFVAGQTQYDVHRQDGNSSALFANTDFELTDQLILTVGARYTQEKKDLVSTYTNVSAAGALTSGTCEGALNGGASGRSLEGGSLTQRLFVGYYCAAYNDTVFNNVTQAQARNDKETTGTVKLAYKPSDNLFSYLSYARGFKAGGFNLDRARVPFAAPYFASSGIGARNTSTAFAPETVDSYELGLKTTWLAGKLLVNGAVFQQDYQGFQLNAFDGIAFTVTSIPEAQARGVDLDVLWQTPLTGLSIQGGTSYNESRFGENLPGYNVATSPFYISPTPANPATPNGALYRLNDGILPFAPKWSSSVAATYQHPVGELLLRTNVSAKYSSHFNLGSDLNPLKDQKAMTLVNALVSLGAKDDSWALELWGQNIGDVYYKQVAFDATFQPSKTNAFLGAPRTYGLTLRLKPLKK